jgi:transcriptional regulator with XRE-family HTH domain
METLFSDRLKGRMEEIGVKPGELAGAVGVSISAVLQWLGGTTKGLKPENLFAVSDALGVEARWLGTGKGPKELLARAQRREPKLKVDRQAKQLRTKRQ